MYLQLKEKLYLGQMDTGLGRSNVCPDVLVVVQGRSYRNKGLERSEDEDVFRLLRLTFKSAGRVQVFVYD